MAMNQPSTLDGTMRSEQAWQTPALTVLSLRDVGKVRSGSRSAEDPSIPSVSAAPSDDKTSPSGDGLLVSYPTQPNKSSPAGDGLTVSYP
jgi:hypothetical protein